MAQIQTTFDGMPLGPISSIVLETLPGMDSAILAGAMEIRKTPGEWPAVFGAQHLYILGSQAFVMFMGQINAFGAVSGIDAPTQPNPRWQLSILNRHGEMQLSCASELQANGMTVAQGGFGNWTNTLIPASNGFGGGWIRGPVIGAIYLGN